MPQTIEADVVTDSVSVCLLGAVAVTPGPNDLADLMPQSGFALWTVRRHSSLEVYVYIIQKASPNELSTRFHRPTTEIVQVFDIKKQIGHSRARTGWRYDAVAMITIIKPAS
jgi:hypothetical protein